MNLPSIIFSSKKKNYSGIIFITLIFYNVFKISYIQLCYENQQQSVLVSVYCWSIRCNQATGISLMIYLDFIFVLAATFGKRKGKVRLDASSMSPLLSDQSRDRSPRPSIPSLDLQGFKCWNGNSIKHNESNESIEEKPCDKSIE